MMRFLRRRILQTLPLALLLAACGKVKEDMYDQPRYDALEPSRLFDDGSASRPAPPGTLPYASGTLAGTSSGQLGFGRVAAALQAQAAITYPRPLTPALLARGRERYAIYCEPCHSPLGDGQGRVVERGFPAPPSYHSDRLRAAPDRHFYDVISDGYGVMYSYADRVAPADRWAIVAYIRALLLSQHAPLAQLPAELRERISADGSAVR
ncbi:MAG: c-type cytochrome [Gammaproteobacteria bacterium]